MGTSKNRFEKGKWVECAECDESLLVRLYALRGGLKKQAVCYTHFHSNKVFRGDHVLSLFFQLFNRKNPSQMKVKLKARYLLQFSEKSCIIETEAAAAAALINYRRKIKWQRMKYLSKHLQDTCM